MTASLLLALAVAAQPAPAPAPADAHAAPQPSTPVPAPRAITLDDAVAAAVAHRPAVRASREAAAADEASAREARGALLPQVALDARYAHARTDPADDRPFTTDTNGASLSGDLLVWDFGRTSSRWRSAQASAEAASEDARATAQQAILEARLAYFGVLEAIALDEVATETVANAERHLGDTEAMVQAGSRAAIDLARLRTQLASARAALVRTHEAVRTARTRLDVAMGAPGQPRYATVAPSIPALAAELRPTDALFVDAVQARPELASLRASVSAGAHALKAADRALWPSLRASAGATGAGSDALDPAWTTSAGVTLSWPLFDGLSSRAAARGARARLEATRAQLDDRGQQVWREIDGAASDVASARAQLPAAEEGVAAARELLGYAEARYREGVGSSLELADAELALANAAAQRVQVEYDLASARARLLAAVGQEAWN
ncbi:MAG TPA: TolC family protein [Anaeromyxobacter sp.]|nr:TolC family protein [Anaeromyxobacter sp.]